MSQKDKNNSNEPSSSVLEGEIVDEKETVMPSEEVVKKGFGKMFKAILVVLFVSVGGLLGFLFVKGDLNTGLSSFFVESQPEQDAAAVESTFSAEAAVNELISANEALYRQFVALEARVSSLEEMPDPEVSVAEADPAIIARLEQVENSLADKLSTVLEQPQLGSQAFTEGLGLIEERLQKLEALQATPIVVPSVEVAPSVSAAMSSEADYFMSLVSLSRAVSSGRLYNAELLEVEAYSGAGLTEESVFDSQIEKLRASALKGVPTNTEIMTSFRSLAALTLNAESNTVEMSWWQRFWANIKGVVTVRQKGDVAGEDIGALLARAEVRLERGDYADAYEILLGTTLAEQEVLLPLLEMLREKINTQDAINILISSGLEGQNN